MPETVRDQSFYEQTGFNAFRMGLTSFDAPYKPGDKRLVWWLAGYQQAKLARAKPLEISEKNRTKPSANVDRRVTWTRGDTRRVIAKAKAAARG